MSKSMFLFSAVITTYVLYGAFNPQDTKSTSENLVNEQIELNKQKKSDQIATCKKELPKRTAQFEALMKAKLYISAANKIEECANALDDNDLKIKVSDAKMKDNKNVMQDKSSTAKEKFKAAESLVKSHPEQFKSLEKQLPSLKAKAEAEEKSNIAAENNSINIGMSEEDVIASNWGFPKSINTTKSAYGTNRQWVYGNGNYLYFTNGVLTTIQN